jgi:hypothetical protein
MWEKRHGKDCEKYCECETAHETSEVGKVESERDSTPERLVMQEEGGVKPLLHKKDNTPDLLREKGNGEEGTIYRPPNTWKGC